MKLDNALPSFEETNNRPAIQPRAASNGTTHMPTEPPSNENQLPAADKGTLNDKLSKFKKERQLIDEQLGKQDADLASRLRTMHTFPFIEDICAVFRQLALDSPRITAKEREGIDAVDKGRCDSSQLESEPLEKLLRSGLTPGANVISFGRFSLSLAKRGEIPLHERIKFSVEVGWASQGRKSPSSEIPSNAGSAVRTRNDIVHPKPLQQEVLDYAAVEGLLCWFLAQLYAMLGCPESRAFEAYYKGDPIEGRVVAVVDGGLLVNIGFEVFVPSGEIDIIPPNDLSPFFGNTYPFKVVKPNDERGKVILSRRPTIELDNEMERSKRWNAFMESKKPGDIVKGVVKNLTFSCTHVELDGMDGPVRISREGVEKEKHVVKLDEKFEARVVEPNETERCIHLTIKGANYSARLATYSEQASDQSFWNAALDYRPTP